MGNETTIPETVLQAQIEAYRVEKENHYDYYAKILERVLKKACAVNLPEAVVQTRPKSMDSFAEKCVRKYEKYKDDALHHMTDLCGARMIVQTLDQVAAVREFVKANFDIVEEDEKGANFADAEFGYRDVHYIVRLRAERCAALGISDQEREVVGQRCAEMQVRTWMQHAWADTLHDRMYKTTLKHPREFRRVASLLAALMEDGDRSFNALATELDGMLANYTAYAARQNVEREMKSQELILANIEAGKRPRAALQLAHLHSAQGHYAEAVAALEDYAASAGPLRPEILMDLGYALCKQHRATPGSPEYQRGLAVLEQAVGLFKTTDASVPLNARKHNSLLARALARKAWALDTVRGRAAEARACYQEALEREPGNPYHLTDVVGHEIAWLRKRDVVGALRAAIRGALATCRKHIENGTEMPFACFAAGRLHLLLGEETAALNEYARGIAHFLACDTCCAPDVLDTEEEWILRVVEPDQPAGGFDWALRLFALARRIKTGAPQPSKAAVELPAPALILAGGAATLGEQGTHTLAPILKRVFAGLRGTVVSGGTDCGVPGCAGAAAAALGQARAFKLVGFRPARLPDDAPVDRRYDLQVTAGEDRFTPEQVIRCWEVLLEAGIAPAEVRLIGYGGGPIAAFEYRLSLALGASVGVVETSGGTADAILADEVWTSLPNLLALPHDPDTLRAFAHPADDSAPFTGEPLEIMAQAFHANYVANSQGKLPPGMRPWPKLGDTFKTANREQARYAVNILAACGFVVRPATDPAQPVVFADFTADEIERMAEMEHGRWNVERLRDGWRHGKRDDAKKQHDCLLPWAMLPDGENGVKKYDREAVRKFPEILAQAGLEVVKKEP